MCLEEYTQEYVDELHEIELERLRNRADEAESRADEAESRADTEKNRADNAENQINRNVVTMLKDQMSDEAILRYTGISREKLLELKALLKQ